MQFKILTAEQAISYHLTLLSKIDAKTTVFSSLISILRDSREITGRNLESGEKLTNPTHGRLDSWLGAMGYLTILDQIGKCYRPKSKQNLTKKNSIQKALNYFTELKEKEINAIYALRCAFSHDYSLFNLGNKGSKDPLTHHFTVTGLGYDTFITLPKHPWDGNHNNKTLENRTIINVIKLGDLVESSYSQHNIYFKKRELLIDLIGGHFELKDRYLMFAYEETIS